MLLAPEGPKLQFLDVITFPTSVVVESIKLNWFPLRHWLDGNPYFTNGKLYTLRIKLSDGIGHEPSVIKQVYFPAFDFCNFDTFKTLSVFPAISTLFSFHWYVCEPESIIGAVAFKLNESFWHELTFPNCFIMAALVPPLPDIFI